MNKTPDVIECHSCGYFGNNEGDVTCPICEAPL